MMKLWILFFVLNSLVFAEDCFTDYQVGNNYYNNDEFKKAIDSYKICLDQGVESSVLHFNIANAYYRLGNVGRSILHYEIAILLNPSDQDYRANLQFARLLQKDKQHSDELEQNPIFSFIYKIHVFVPINEGLFLLLGLMLILALVFSVIYYTDWNIRFALYPLALVLVVAIFGGFLSVGYRIWQLEHDIHGIVLEPSTDVMSGPGDKYQVLYTLNEGTRFSYDDEQDGWYAIRIGEDIAGYIKSSNAGLIQ
jgi:tetratricopeptide (TPR) repeat protein